MNATSLRLCAVLCLSCLPLIDTCANQSSAQNQERPSNTEQSVESAAAERRRKWASPKFLGSYQFSEMATGAFKPHALSFTLMFQSMREDLQLNDRQLAQLRTAQREGRAAHLKLADQLSKRVQENLANGIIPDVDSFRTAREALDSQIQDDSIMQLNDKQIRRLGEIMVQARGPFAVLTDDDLIAQLGVTPRQLERASKLLAKIAEGNQEFGKELAAVSGFKGTHESADAGKAASVDQNKSAKNTREEQDRWVSQAVGRKHEVEQAVMNELESLLTQRQKQRYARLAGKPFDFDRMFQRQSGKTSIGSNVPPSDKK